MRVGIAGAGNVGVAVGRRLADRGHAVAVSFARTPEALASAVAAIGGGTRGGEPGEAALFGDVALLATPWGATLDAPEPIAPALAYVQGFGPRIGTGLLREDAHA